MTKAEFEQLLAEAFRACPPTPEQKEAMRAATPEEVWAVCIEVARAAGSDGHGKDGLIGWLHKNQHLSPPAPFARLVSALKPHLQSH
jgi:hypothetical protein